MEQESAEEEEVAYGQESAHEEEFEQEDEPEEEEETPLPMLDQKADVLFLTDGEFASPPEEFLQNLAKARNDIGVSLVSLVLFANNQQCELFSDRVVSAMRLDDRGRVRMAFEDVFRSW